MLSLAAVAERGGGRLPNALGAAAAVGLLLACGALVFPASHGDAAIYFNYFRRFFTLPFSYQPGIVTYGATSPLHVVLFAGVRALAGPLWYPAAKVVNLALVGLGLWELARAQRRPHAFLTAVALALAFRTMWVASAQLFEVGVTFLAVAVFLARYPSGSRLALVVAGLLPAVRPELALITLATGLDCLWRRQRAALAWIALGATVPTLYTLYMGLAGAGWIPSSAASRVLRAYEGETSWWARWAVTLNFLRDTDPAYLVLLPTTLVAVWFVPQRRAAALVLLPLLAAFVAVPPRYFAPRYFVPLVPAIVSVLVTLYWRLSARLSPRRVLPVALVALFAAWQLLGHSQRRDEYARYDRARWLLEDLSARLNPLLGPDDAVLVYEIQIQDGLAGRAISVDGTVGRDVAAMLAGEEAPAAFLRRAHVRFVVTSNAFAYRSIYDDTLFEALYVHDLTHPLGAELTVDGLRFRKLFTNPSFAEPGRFIETRYPHLNHGDATRMYADPQWFGYSILWNSVYAVAPADTAP